MRFVNTKYPIKSYLAIFLFAAFFLPVQIAVGQETFRFRHLQKDDGLSSDDVLCIMQDHVGYIWIGTQNGLNRYNGYDFKVYKKIEGDSTSLSGNWVNSIYEDPTGAIWVGTQGGGVSKLDPWTDKFTRYTFQKNTPNCISDDDVWSIKGNGDLGIWIGTYNGGLNYYDLATKQFSQLTAKQSNATSSYIKEVVDILPDGLNKVWMTAGSSGLIHYDRSTGEVKRPIDKSLHGGNSKGSYTRTIARGYKNEIWTLSSLQLAQYFPEQDSLVSWPVGKDSEVGLNSIYIKSILLDSKGALWIGSKDEGLYRYTTEYSKFRNYTYSEQPFSLKHSDISYIYEDNAGLIWIALRGRGVNVLSYQDIAFKHWTSVPLAKNTLIDKGVRAVFQDHNSKVWIGTNLGISKFDLHSHEFENYNNYSPESNTLRVRAFVEYKNTLITGTEGGGILTFDTLKNNFKNVKISPPVLESFAQGVRTLLITNDSSLWCGTNRGGLLLLDPKTFVVKEQYITSPKKDSIPSNIVQVIIPHKENELWIGTDKGISLFNTKEKKFKTWSKIDSKVNSLVNNKVRSLYQDTNGILWIGTRGGFSRFDLTTEDFKQYTTQDGLASEIIFGIYEDDHERLWLTTPNGLSRMDKKTETFKHIRVELNNKLDMGAHFKTVNGRIIAGGANGFVIFHPDSITTNPHIPKIVFTSFSANGVPRIIQPESKNRQSIYLNYDENDFTLNFAAFDFNDPSKNQYAYFMGEEGREKRVDLGNQHQISFSNIEPGAYNLRVIGSNNDGLWNEVGASLHIVISPPWWKTTWFRILLALCILGSFVGFYYYRMASVKKQNEDLERIVAERTYELQIQKNEIVAQNEEIRQQSEELSAQRDYLKEQNIEIIESRNTIRLLSDFGKELNSSLNLEHVQKMIYSYISSSVSEMDAFGIGLFRTTRKTIEYQVFYENDERLEYFTCPLDANKNFSSLVISTGKEIFENDIELNWTKYFENKYELIPKEGARSVAAIPLMSEGTTLGALTVYSKKTNAFSEKDIALLTSLATYVSIALGNAKLYGEVNRKNEHINSSIHYAKRIQQSILPILDNVQAIANSFTLYLPKDIVSGDFYQFMNLSETNTRDAIFATVDCTGHGVPGAFMSLIGNRILNQIVNERKVYDPGQILDELHNLLQLALKQEETDNNDGMDVAICRITDSKIGTTVTYAGAKRPLYYSTPEHKIQQIAGTRKSIGGTHSRQKDVLFESSTLDLPKNTMLYLTSDGYIDQNNEENKRFGSKAFVELLEVICTQELHLQQQNLQNSIDRFRNTAEQRDDITVWGIRI